MAGRSDDIDLDAVDAYDYALPDKLIAAHPSEQRTDSRLLIAQRNGRQIEHRRFADVGDYLNANDLLVFNDTRVVPARIMTRKQTGGAVELLVTDIICPGGKDRWTTPADGALLFECLTRSSRPLREAMELDAEADTAAEFTVNDWDAGQAVIEVDWDASAVELLEEVGQMPLPPYILKRREAVGEEGAATSADRDRYQTVYAEQPGAVAAPTAGLHFSQPLLEQLKADGVDRAFVTLQVGVGTFRPVSAARLSDHDMHSEEYRVSADLAEAVDQTRSRGGRIIAVGTTSARALEAEARRNTPFGPGVRRTALFLRPGEPFEVCDGLITNFHLPRSTLLALVAGFAGYEFMQAMYVEAVDREYRFYSYGDAMLIV